MKEKTKNKVILYHVCEPYDISSVKIYEEESRKTADKSINVGTSNNNLFYPGSGATMVHRNYSTDEHDPLGSSRRMTLKNQGRDSELSSFSTPAENLKQKTAFNYEEQPLSPAPIQMVRQHSVVNFIKDKHSYEFFTPQNDEKKAPSKDKKNKDPAFLGHGS